MIGKTLGHYAILDKLGAGGMGEVYRAHDERLDRDVALKVLPAGLLADESARHRFRKEALALAKLNHPNIEAVYDFDTQAGVDFLVMEYVPGVTLSDKLALGPLREKELIRYGEQLAEGLAAAHAQGIVHRDLKPGNLRIAPDGRLKILDFGLAKLVTPATDQDVTASLTETKAVAGTLPYMAPEQLRGEPVDARTDLYAVGVVLYEMATGRRPFEHQLSTALAEDIQHKPAPPPGRLKTDLSTRVEDIILKCLEKEPESRYQSARELLVDLRRLIVQEAPRVASRRAWSLQRPTVALVSVLVLIILSAAGYFAWKQFWPAAQRAPGKIMLAVLPVDNLSGDPEQEYFSDGLTEEMIAELGSLQPHRLGVIARTSAMRYKHTQKPIDLIGRELGVEYILESSVRREAGRVRITAQLIQVSDQTHLWAESYERELAGVFAVQSEVAQRVANSLAVELLPAEQARLARKRPVNPEAHEAYLKGLYYWNKRTREALLKGLEYFQRAIEADPNYAQAHAGVADSYAVLGGNGHLPPEEAFPKAKLAAQKALELDETLAEAHTSLGLILEVFDWNWAGAEQEFKRSIELNPGYATGHQWYANLLAILGRTDKALEEIKEARRLDPLSPRILTNVGTELYLARKYDAAIEELRKVLDVYPDHDLSHIRLGLAYLHKGLHGQAIAEIRKASALEGAPELVGVLAYAYALAGQRAEALKILDELTLQSKRRYVAPTEIAIAYGALGEKDQAFRWLETAYGGRDALLMYIRVEPRYDPLRSDPRFQSLLRRMNFPP